MLKTMATSKISAIFLLCIHVALGQNLTTTIESTTTVSNTTTEPIPETYDYVIKLVFSLENEKVPEYLLNSIFDYSNNITTEDIISLYTLESLNLTSTIDVLEKLQYNPSKTLSIDGLERFLSDFNIGFTDFYNAVFIKNLKVSGLPLRNFLIQLGIKTGEFSDAITFGDPDPFEIFKNGNFSEDNLGSALQGLGKNVDDLFESCRDEILRIGKSKTTRELFNILKKHNFDKVEAMNLWEVLELEVKNAENVIVFANLLDQLKFNLENASYLGILTSKKAAINKIIYTNIKEKMELSKIFAQSLYDNITVELKEEKLYYENIITLNLESDNFTSFIDVATTNKDLEHCRIITLENETLVSLHVEKVRNKGNSLEVSTDEFNATTLIQGSPLICDNKVYGLANEINDDEIVFDTFVVHSGVIKLVFNQFIFVACFVIYLKL